MRDLVRAYAAGEPYQDRPPHVQVAEAIEMMRHNPRLAVELLPEKLTTRIREILSQTQLARAERGAGAFLSLDAINYEGQDERGSRGALLVGVLSSVHDRLPRSYRSRFRFDDRGDHVERLQDDPGEVYRWHSTWRGRPSL
jgi:hypothetical protein